MPDTLQVPILLVTHLRRIRRDLPFPVVQLLQCNDRVPYKGIRGVLDAQPPSRKFARWTARVIGFPSPRAFPPTSRTAFGRYCAKLCCCFPARGDLRMRKPFAGLAMLVRLCAASPSCSQRMEGQFLPAAWISSTFVSSTTPPCTTSERMWWAYTWSSLDSRWMKLMEPHLIKVEDEVQLAHILESPV